MRTNGRARGPGRWTRAGLAVSRSNDCKPLPFHLQVLPMKMTPTAHHPDCPTTYSQYGLQVELETWHTPSFVAGKLLSRTPAKWRIDICGRVYYTDNAILAIAWVRAANHIRHRCNAELSDNENRSNP